MCSAARHPSWLPMTMPPQEMPPLCVAADHGNLVLLNQLLQGTSDTISVEGVNMGDGEEPVDVDERGPVNWSALHFACAKGHVDCARQLILKGAVVNARTLDSMSTPLHVACIGAHEDCVQLLLDAGAEKEVKDEWGETPRQKAALYAVPDRHDDIVSTLDAWTTPAEESREAWLKRTKRAGKSPRADAPRFLGGWASARAAVTGE